MSKRSLEITTKAIITKDIKNSNLKKKIKVLNENITEKILEMDENLELENPEVSKFLLIFGQLTKTMTSEETFEETDGIVSDTVSVICNLITDLLKNNIDELSIPKPIRISLKILKKFFKLIKDKQLEENAEHSYRAETTEETSETSGEGGEENDRIRVRNRRYKIKRMTLQARNVDVRHNGRVVRRMVVRRQTLYPSTRRRREY